jgi:ABC-type transporter Mla subunit MlaD
MHTIKRFLAWTLVVISILGILACTIGVVGSWLINDDLTNRILRILSGAQATLSSVEDSLTLASTQLNTANTAINTIRETASQLGTKIEENTPLLDKITSALTGGLSPSIDKIRAAFLPIWERVLAINNTIEALNALPGIELPTLTPQLEALNDQIQQVSDAVEQLQADISDLKTGVVENVLVPFLAKIDTVATFLTTLEKDVNTYLVQVMSIQAAVKETQARVPSTIDSLTVLLSILLVWAILAQIGLILVASLYLRTGKMVWEFTASKRPADEALLEPGP